MHNDSHVNTPLAFIPPARISFKAVLMYYMWYFSINLAIWDQSLLAALFAGSKLGYRSKQSFPGSSFEEGRIVVDRTVTLLTYLFSTMKSG